MKMTICRWFMVSALLSISWLPFVSYARLGIAAGSGQGLMPNFTPMRAAVLWDFGAVWTDNCLWDLNLLYESSVGMWNGSLGLTGGNDKVEVFTVSPTFRFNRMKALGSTKAYPYIELSIGASLLSQTEFGGRILSTSYQFEDKIGVGLRFGEDKEYDINYRFFHYSNASMKRPNSGINLHLITFGLWFDFPKSKQL